jgi:hypothetical protein
MWILFAALIFSCTEPAECLCKEDFIEKWWQVEISDSLVGNCYLFAEDGYIVESDGQNNWPTSKYEIEQIGECQYSLSTEDSVIEIFGMQEGCLDLEYDGNKYSACECSL